MIDGKQVQHQGALDGLCGPYAIANALALCGVSSFAAVFQACVLALPKSRWPKGLWEGTDWYDLQRMLRALGPTLRRHSLAVSFPFEEREPASPEKYWEGFDAHFARAGARVAILGLRKPRFHWIVARPHGGSIQFIDSNPDQPTPIKERASLKVGKLNPKASWLIDPGELILFSRGEKLSAPHA